MKPLSYPLFVAVLAFVVFAGSAKLGDFLRNRVRPLKDEDRDGFGIVLSANLTLLALLIGFTFSMAISRYDLRKGYEEAEANAIGTEYVRADFLPAGDAVKVRGLLKKYIDQRVMFYTTKPSESLAQNNADTAKLQNELWSAIRPAANAQPTPIMALTVSGMNDVLNSQGYTQAAWWNRIPKEAWWLMTSIAICSNILVGYVARRTDWRTLVIMPLAVSISFFLISDIDSPRGGLIHVTSQNLLSLSESLKAQ